MRTKLQLNGLSKDFLLLNSKNDSRIRERTLALSSPPHSIRTDVKKTVSCIEQLDDFNVKNLLIPTELRKKYCVKKTIKNTRERKFQKFLQIYVHTVLIQLQYKANLQFS